MPVPSAYAPTSKVPPGIKTKFLDELQDTLDSVPHGNSFVLLGGFNARVGKYKFEDDM